MNADNVQFAALLQFTNELSLALVMAFVALHFRHILKFGSPWAFALYDGVVFGAIGLAIMQFPFPIAPGAALDVRVVPVAIAGLFSGPPAAIVAGLIVAAYRVYIGGPGVIAGTGAILTAALLGAVFAHRWRDSLHRIGVGTLGLVGLGLVVITLGWTLILPSNIVNTALAAYTVPVLVTHPLGVIILGWLVFYEDKRHRTEVALRESQARLSAIIENSTAAVYLKDVEGRYTLVNRLFASRFGRDVDSILGKTAIDLFPPHIAEAILIQDRAVLETAAPKTFEVETVYADDDLHSEMAVKFPIIDANGSVTAIGGISADITELKRAEAAARRNEALFREFFDKSHFLFLTLDSEARVTACNDYLLRLLGYERSEIIGCDWIDTVIPADERQTIRRIFEDSLAMDGETATNHIENDILTRDGEIRRIEWDSVVTRGPNQDAPTTIAVGTDVTEQRRAEEEAALLRDRLAHVARIGTMGEMATGFAHELNQPLAAINNYARGLQRRMQRGEVESAMAISILEQLATQAERAGEIIRRIRWFVKKNAPSKSPTDLNRAIVDAIAFLRSEAEESRIEINLHFDEAVPEMKADAVQIQQVVINLVKNAIEALRTIDGRPRRIDVRTALRNDGQVEITVADTGPGLPPEIVAELFEPFVTTKAEGMGIGLSICRSTVQAHGGEMSAAPNPEGGTVFRFTLPISAET